MRGAFIIGLGPDLCARAATQVALLGGVRTDEPGDGMVQIADGNGRLLTMYETIPSGTEWELHEGPFTVADGVNAPDMEALTGCPLECRWPDYVAEIARAIAVADEAPTWVLDGDGVIWDAPVR